MLWSVLQCVAVCCNVLQCVAVCCNALKCVAVQPEWHAAARVRKQTWLIQTCIICVAGNRGAGAAIIADEDDTKVLEISQSTVERIRYVSLTCLFECIFVGGAGAFGCWWNSTYVCSYCPCFIQRFVNQPSTYIPVFREYTTILDWQDAVWPRCGWFKLVLFPTSCAFSVFSFQGQYGHKLSRIASNRWNDSRDRFISVILLPVASLQNTRVEILECFWVPRVPKAHSRRNQLLM